VLLSCGCGSFIVYRSADQHESKQSHLKKEHINLFNFTSVHLLIVDAVLIWDRYIQNMSTTDDNDDQCGYSASCEQNNIDNITKGINSLAVLDNVSTCAACGKEGNSDIMNTCNKCKMVKYCNAACKKKHRSKHKKACERRVAELHDEQLFKEVEREECPICMLPMPLENYTSSFKSCCGKRICAGCVYAMKTSEGKDLCAFCRTPPSTSHKEDIKRIKKLMEKVNAGAFNYLGGLYSQGECGLPRDYRKANDLWLKAGELGCSEGYHNLGVNYIDGNGVENDLEKAKYYFELAAMNGHISARNNVACLEGAAGNEQRAYKHMIISARAGVKESLNMVKKGFMKGLVSKDEYTDILRAHQTRQDEMKSDERDKAAEFVAEFQLRRSMPVL